MNEKLLFTRDNIRIDNDILYGEDYINAYIETWFDAEAKFNITLDEDEYVNVYASYYPKENKLIVDFTYYGNALNHGGVYDDVTKEEEELILQMMNEVNIKNTGLTMLEYWKQIQTEEVV